MRLYNLLTILIVLSAAFGYINHRYFKLPNTIGIMLISLIMSLVLVAIGQYVPSISDMATNMILSVDFSRILMEIMLSFLLFAGALHVDVKTLSKERLPVLIFSTIGVTVSTFLVGVATYYLLLALEMPTPFIHCLLFGALISPTDPIAVLAILKKAGVPKSLEVKITGESLFNDGIAVVVFLTIFEMADKGVANVGFTDISILFLQEAVGGALFGLVLGWIGYYLLKSIDAYNIEVLITIAMVMGGYVLASQLHLSGPLAVVVIGLMMSDRGKLEAMSDVTREYTDKFWEIVDEVLNAILFVLIGFEILVIPFQDNFVIAGIISIAVVLISRLISIGIPISLMKLKRTFIPNTVLVMAWGGLRGGISVALALSLKPEMSRELIVTMTYIVVIFSIVVQGLSISPLIKKLKIA